MHSVWKGSISFGLVNIPIALFPATREERLRFKMLRKSDLSPVNLKRVAQADGKTVEWGDIVKGYEYEKGKFVVLKEEDFKRVDVEATHSIDIVDFVKLDEIDPMHYDAPYFVEPAKGADRAYALMRDALAESGTVGIAKVVIHTKQHLAAVKPNGKLLVLELMHFRDEIRTPDAIKAPESGPSGKEEMAMALHLIDKMTHKWDAGKYQDEYTQALHEIIHEKIAAGGKELPVKGKTDKGKPATNVIDLVTMLQQSITKAAGGGKSKGSAKPKPEKKAAKAGKTIPFNKAA